MKQCLVEQTVFAELFFLVYKANGVSVFLYFCFSNAVENLFSCIFMCLICLGYENYGQVSLCTLAFLGSTSSVKYATDIFSMYFYMNRGPNKSASC